MVHVEPASVSMYLQSHSVACWPCLLQRLCSACAAPVAVPVVRSLLGAVGRIFCLDRVPDAGREAAQTLECKCCAAEPLFLAAHCWVTPWSTQHDSLCHLPHPPIRCTRRATHLQFSLSSPVRFLFTPSFVPLATFAVSPSALLHRQAP